MNYDILHRYAANTVIYSATLDASLNRASKAAKLGNATRLAIQQRVSLHGANLRGADLTGADLTDADLTDADLTYADLRGADLTRADLTDADLTGANIIDGGLRSDGYRFFLVRHADGALYVRAGCRDFSLSDAREHWQRTRGGTRLGDESQALIDHLERMAKIAGWLG